MTPPSPWRRMVVEGNHYFPAASLQRDQPSAERHAHHLRVEGRREFLRRRRRGSIEMRPGTTPSRKMRRRAWYYKDERGGWQHHENEPPALAERRVHAPPARHVYGHAAPHASGRPDGHGGHR